MRISKVERGKLAGALGSCFVLFATLQQCAPMEPGGNRTRDPTVRKQASNRCATSAKLLTLFYRQFRLHVPVEHRISGVLQGG